MIQIPLTSDEITEDIDLDEGLDEDRTVGPQDEDDDDPTDTTPAEAEKQADEGEEIFKRIRKPASDE